MYGSRYTKVVDFVGISAAPLLKQWVEVYHGFLGHGRPEAFPVGTSFSTRIASRKGTVLQFRYMFWGILEEGNWKFLVPHTFGLTHPRQHVACAAAPRIPVTGY